MKKLIQAGATDQTIDIFVLASNVTTGAGLTGLAFNTASLTCYFRKGATGSATALTLATQTVGGAHSDGGFVEIDATNMPGMYRLDLSDTIVNTAGSVTLMLKGAANMAPVTIELQIVAFNPNDGVRLGLTALPNAAADAAGGLPISDAGGLDMDAILSRIGTPSNLGGGATLAANNVNMAGATFDTSTDSQEAIRNRGDSAWTTATGFSTLDAAGVRSAVGLASANLDTQLDALPTAAEIVAAQLTTAITEAYRANGAAPTLAQFMSEVLAHLGEASISGTTKTINRFDHSTAAETFTLDSATDPSSITRAS